VIRIAKSLAGIDGEVELVSVVNAFEGRGVAVCVERTDNNL
jgi:hypothetical protein